ncbi:GGDEF domain-containing protein [Catellatospora tritici]|uniref:GGDEF domain-containing protein n=1 Tax=Catellatospora tritici TaxID=2851566 RepID=UPI001C2DE0A2|nr:GGDEF domain-containing protein [Catellatospora tritici]MBV1854366.1 GGDEF domain-containing protein [Catellatospora tritici]
MTIERDMVDEVTEVVADCDSVTRACNAVVSIVNARACGPVEALLSTSSQLALIACSGAWQAPRAIPVTYGIVGHVLATGHAAAIANASIEYAGLHLGRPVGSVVCAPITGGDQPAFGVLNVECDRIMTELDAWTAALTEVGVLLGTRILQLGGPPGETRAEQLLRHTLAFAAVDDPTQLAADACRAAVEICGLGSAILLVRSAEAIIEWRADTLNVAATYSEPGSRRLVDTVAALDPRCLSAMIDAACHYGASQSQGDPDGLDARGFEPLTQAGVRTLIATPVRGPAAAPELDAAMLVMDELAVRSHPSTVSVLQLLMANAAVCYERMSTLRQLQVLADFDRLTGLGNLGPFNRRLAATVPSHTALLAIDIDGFKQVNDTYGHAEGDKVLTAVATAMRQALRDRDEVFRVGGDEFVAVLEVSDEAHAVRVAERLVAAAAGTGCGISVGIALRRPDEPAEATLHRADEAMYVAKRDDAASVHLAV